MRLGWIVTLALAVLSAGASPGRAGLELCNGTAAPAVVAVAYMGTEDWVSNGWWQIEPDKCAEAVRGDLTNRYVYYLAQIYGQTIPGGDFVFCIDPKRFAIEGTADCEARGYSEGRFTEIDTGGKTVSFTYTIGGSTEKGQGVPDAQGSAATPQAAPEFTNGVGLFNGCFGEKGKRHCVIVEDWERLEIYEADGTPAAMLDQLAALPINTVVEFDDDFGDQSLEKYGVSVAIRLRRLSVTPGDSAPGLLNMLQGRWIDAAKPTHEILIYGSELHNYTAGKATTNALIAIVGTCESAGAATGPFLVTLPFSGAEENALLPCFSIDHVGPDRFEVTNVKTGAKQRYLPTY